MVNGSKSGKRKDGAAMTAEVADTIPEVDIGT
jgi:hypothetical protein